MGKQSRPHQHRKWNRRGRPPMPNTHDFVMPRCYPSLCPVVLTATSTAAVLALGMAIITLLVLLVGMGDKTPPIDFAYPEGVTEDQMRGIMAKIPGRVRGVETIRMEVATQAPGILGGLPQTAAWCEGAVVNLPLIERVFRAVNITDIPAVWPRVFALQPDEKTGLRASDRTEMQQAGVPEARITQAEEKLAQDVRAGKTGATLLVHVKLLDAMPVVHLPDDDPGKHHPVVVAAIPIPPGQHRSTVMVEGLPPFLSSMFDYWLRKQSVREEDRFMEYGFFSPQKSQYEELHYFFLRPVTPAYVRKHQLQQVSYSGKSKATSPLASAFHVTQ